MERNHKNAYIQIQQGFPSSLPPLSFSDISRFHNLWQLLVHFKKQKHIKDLLFFTNIVYILNDPYGC